MAGVDTYQKEITTVFYNAWTALANGIPVAWPKRNFDATAVKRYVKFNVVFANEQRKSIGGVTNYFDQEGLVVVSFYSSVDDTYTINEDNAVIADIKSIFRDVETDSVRFMSDIIEDGPTEVSPFQLTNITFRWVGTILT